MAPLAALVEKRVAPDASVLDVGANIGLSALILSRLCRAGKVTAFEPSPTNLSFLRSNLERNGATNVEVVAAAVGHKHGQVQFFESPFGAGSHVTPPGFDATVQTISVPVLPIDDVVSGSQPVSFMKVDVEGYEPQALAGAARLLQRDQPLVFMEWNSWALGGIAGVSLPAFAASLWRAFEVSRVADDGELAPMLEDRHSFLFSNILRHNCVEDIVLRVRDGASVPTLARMILPAAIADELEHLRNLVQRPKLS